MLKVIEQHGYMKVEIDHYWVAQKEILGSAEKNGLITYHLGEYATPERLKEVFEDMVRFEEWQTTLIAEPANRGYRVLTKIYRMPKE